MADVFLSYKREDAPRVRKLVAALREAGVDTWWDEDIPASAPWESTIEKELARAKAVIVCWSPAAVASDNVRAEARVARNDGRLIQVYVEPCEAPLFFGERQGHDLTGWRGDDVDAHIPPLVENVRAVIGGNERPAAARQHRRKRFKLQPRFAAAAAIVFVLIGAAAGWWWFNPLKASGPTTLAILPFRALNPGDANLVDAIWDDTRGAISKNPNLRVLGRRAVESLADRDLTPAGYRKRVGADYLLDGSVQHVGDQVRMKLILTSTKDGSEVWNDEIGGKLDDVFAFQARIASEVEGRVRGRVAPGGGVKPQNIATSGEVYAIYADARAQLRKRDAPTTLAAIGLLKKAVAIDPNYAPAWATLAQVTVLYFSRTPQAFGQNQRQLGIGYAKRALELAPNLAQAHAALGLVQGMQPEAENELRKAVALDPGNSEAWGWLGNYLRFHNKLSEALAAYTRAEELEPFWVFTVGNRILCLADMKDMDGMKAEFARLSAAGETVLLSKVQGLAAGEFGHPGEKVAFNLKLRAEHPEEAAWIDTRIRNELISLGYIDEALLASHDPPETARDYRDDPRPADALKGDFPNPVDFWVAGDTAARFGRMLPRHGRLNEYVGYYKAAFKTPDQFFDVAGPLRAVDVTPTLAANLRAAGMQAEAAAILERAEPILASLIGNAPPTSGELALQAQYRAVASNDDEAISLLSRAVAEGWIPDNSRFASDITQEPSFARLVNRTDFQAIRRRVFARIEEERRKVPLALLAQAYPVARKAAT